MRIRRFVYSSVLAGALLSGCRSYTKDISIYDTDGNWYLRPKPESSFELQRNRSEVLADVPPGRRGYLIVEYPGDPATPRSRRKTKRWRMDPSFGYSVLMRPDTDIVIEEFTNNRAEAEK